MRFKRVRIVFAIILVAVLSNGAQGGDTVKRRDPFCRDGDSYTPLCTNLIVTDTCHYGNIANTLRWQRDVVRQGLTNYFNGNPVSMAKAAFYMAAYARKLERRGQGYAAATNAYCALAWLQKSAERGCDEARVACYCCFGFGGALGFHGSGMWSGPPSCYSFDLHDVPCLSMSGFEPAPDYLVGEFGGRKRYVRVYDQDMATANKYGDKATHNFKARHIYQTHKKYIGWQQPSDSIEIVRIDFTGFDVWAHVERLVQEMDADIAVAHEQNLKAIEIAREERRRKDEAELQRRLRIYEQEMQENEARSRRKKEQVEDAAFVTFDNDGDGLVNAVDPEPDVAGPDAHGTNAEWYNTVCSNIVTAVDGTNGVELTWRGGVNTNAYYFVDVVTEKGPAPVYFTGDRTSRLGNPAVVARAGETNHVPLLIGISYAVTSSAPFSVSVPSNYKKYTVVERFTPRIVRIRWPLEFKFVESITNGKRSYTVKVLPYDPGGTFSWESPPAKGEDLDDKKRKNKLGDTNSGARKAEN